MSKPTRRVRASKPTQRSKQLASKPGKRSEARRQTVASKPRKPGAASKPIDASKPARRKPPSERIEASARKQVASKLTRSELIEARTRARVASKPTRSELIEARARKRGASKPTPSEPPSERIEARTRKRAASKRTPSERSAEPAAFASHAAPAEPSRTDQIAALAGGRISSGVDGAPVVLGSITVPSGLLAIFDVGLMGYLPRAALDPLLICAPVPQDRALPVVGVRVGKGRFADCWDHVAVALAEPGREVAHARKLGKAAVDFARLIVMDRAAIDHWQHEDSLDQLADVVIWGRDEAALAKALGAGRLAHANGHGWTNLRIADAEAKADRAAQLKSEHKWLVSTELRPHSHHEAALAAARASPAGAGVLEVGGARAMLFFTSWGDGLYPVYLDVDSAGLPVQIRIQLAPVEDV